MKVAKRLRAETFKFPELIHLTFSPFLHTKIHTQSRGSRCETFNKDCTFLTSIAGLHELSVFVYDVVMNKDQLPEVCVQY